MNLAAACSQTSSYSSWFYSFPSDCWLAPLIDTCDYFALLSEIFYNWTVKGNLPYDTLQKYIFSVSVSLKYGIRKFCCLSVLFLFSIQMMIDKQNIWKWTELTQRENPQNSEPQCITFILGCLSSKYWGLNVLYLFEDYYYCELYLFEDYIS